MKCLPQQSLNFKYILHVAHVISMAGKKLLETKFMHRCSALRKWQMKADVVKVSLMEVALCLCRMQIA